MKSRLIDLITRNDGSVAVIFAVMAIPFIAMAGWAVDYLRMQHVKEFLQARVDFAALSVYEDEAVRDRDAQWALVHAVTEQDIRRQYQGDWVTDGSLEITSQWIDARTVRVTARADVPLAFMALIPGIPDFQRIEVSAVGQSQPEAPPYDIAVSELDYEAGDYNRVWAYCYWPDRPAGNPDLPQRTQMVPIADNGGPRDGRNRYLNMLDSEIDNRPPNGDPQLEMERAAARASNPNGLDGLEEGIWRVVDGAGTDSRTYHFFPPECTGQSELSIRLENVRFARGEPDYWEVGDRNYHLGGPRNWGGDQHYGRYNYYTDTVVDSVDNQVKHTGLNYDLLETVICDTRDRCDPGEPGNIIPRGTNRSANSSNPRQLETRACVKEEYVYYGFEDRPPDLPGEAHDWQWQAWTDADYDDITIVISCPVEREAPPRNIRLIG